VGALTLWWIGDWLNYGERAYGETYAQALEETDYGIDMLQKAKWVASKIEPCKRLQHVPWAAHHEVASLPPEQRDELLAEAERDHLTVREVRARVREVAAPVAASVAARVAARRHRPALARYTRAVHHKPIAAVQLGGASRRKAAVIARPRLHGRRLPLWRCGCLFEIRVKPGCVRSIGHRRIPPG
jgi:hypothetical protein